MSQPPALKLKKEPRSHADAWQASVTEGVLQQIARRIVDAYHPKMIIFFGSRLSGKPRPDSDIDLLVVMDARGSWWERHQQVSALFPQPSFRLDAHVYSPEQVVHRLEIGDYFMQDVIERGRVLYPRGSGNGVARVFREKLQQGKEHPMNAEYVKEWIAKAEADYDGATILARQRRKFLPDLLCWTCQQCMGKYFKAFLVRHHIKFERTHILGKLHELCRSVDSDFRLVANVVEPLVPCAPPVRYPGASATAEQARAAFEAMKQARKFIRAKLGLR
jgi:HEPN domain-containing protein